MRIPFRRAADEPVDTDDFFAIRSRETIPRRSIISYDITIWCVEPFTDPTLLPSGEKWTVGADYWSFEAKRWTINTGPSDRVFEEDIPEEVQGRLPGIRYLVSASLEPLGAPKVGHAMLRRLAKTVAKEARGVILDPQEDTVELARGTKRYVSPKRDREERFGLLEMSWWLTNDRLLHAEHVEAFLTVLEDHLPEAMPRRYGLYEPPQHVYAETGRDHLKAFLVENLTDSLVWYANRPVGHWHFSMERECGWRRLGQRAEYRCNHLCIGIDTAALAQPGWPEGLRRFWRRISCLVRPFYGDVRTINGYAGRLPHAWCDARTESHPTQSWWWKGVPPKLGHAVVIGEPYLALWPETEAAGEVEEGLVFLTTQDWSTTDDVCSVVEVPADISLPFMPALAGSPGGGVSMRYPETYPEKFPFGPLPPGAEVTKPKKSRWRFWQRERAFTSEGSTYGYCGCDAPTPLGFAVLLHAG